LNFHRAIAGAAALFTKKIQALQGCAGALLSFAIPLLWATCQTHKVQQ
jgi:hypothetical protein